MCVWFVCLLLFWIIFIIMLSLLADSSVIRGYSERERGGVGRVGRVMVTSSCGCDRVNLPLRVGVK